MDPLVAAAGVPVAGLIGATAGPVGVVLLEVIWGAAAILLALGGC